MLKTTSRSILALAVTACGPAVAMQEAEDEPTCDPWAQVCQATMLPNWDVRAVLDLELARVTVEPTDEGAEMLGEAHVRASIGRFLNLSSAAEGLHLCLLHEPFASLSEVPTDVSVCDCPALTGCWTPMLEFGLVGGGILGTEEDFADFGLLLRTASGELYRGRVLEADANSEQPSLTFEYEGVM